MFQTIRAGGFYYCWKTKKSQVKGQFAFEQFVSEKCRFKLRLGVFTYV